MMLRFNGLLFARGSWVLVGIAGLLIGWPAASRADTATAMKAVTWTMAGAPMAPTMNTYTWQLTAFASGPPAPPNTEQNPFGGGTSSAQWDATMALARTTQNSGTASSGGSKANITETFVATAPTSVGNGLFQVQTTMKFNTSQSPAPGGSTGTSGAGLMTVTSGLATYAEITNPGQSAQPLPMTKLEGSPQFATFQGKFGDPIDVSLYDASDNDLIASQQLGAINMSSNLAGGVEWDNTGLTLSAPIDGVSSADISADIGNSDGNGDYADSWITDSDTGLSTVSLANGTFSATGIFAGLPWVLDNPSAPTMATLAPGYLDSLGLDYQIPASLVSPDGEYYEQLTSQDSIEIDESLPLPEPTSASIVLLAVGAATRARPARRVKARRRLVSAGHQSPTR
jgi:hypothetical protein